MKILIIYATYSGGTHEAVKVLESSLTSNQTVQTAEAQAVEPSQVGDHDLVILASPSWNYQGEEGMPHEDFLKLFDKLAGQKYQNKKFALLGLGDSSYEKFCGAVDHLAEFVNKVEGQLIDPPLKIDGYFFAQEENNQKITTWADQIIKKTNK